MNKETLTTTLGNLYTQLKNIKWIHRMMVKINKFICVMQNANFLDEVADVLALNDTQGKTLEVENAALSMKVRITWDQLLYVLQTHHPKI